jgi:hypothetical protein
VSAEPLRHYVVTDHARFEMARRGLSLALVAEVLARPEQRLQVRPGREVFQSRHVLGDSGDVYLIRVFADTYRWPAEVVTAYRTRRIRKYWREPE